MVTREHHGLRAEEFRDSGGDAAGEEAFRLFADTDHDARRRGREGVDAWPIPGDRDRTLRKEGIVA